MDEKRRRRSARLSVAGSKAACHIVPGVITTVQFPFIHAVSTERTGPQHPPLLVGTGAFAFLWVMARARVQSITIDEADTYLAFVGRPNSTHWAAAANNHVLNSMLMRLVTMIFGSTEFTLRIPALIGAALYIGSLYFLVRLITDRRLLQWSLFVCLVFSPFVMDYLVAARGYSLALAFLTCAVTLAAWRHAGFGFLHQTAALISLSLALSISANFSFAVVDAVTGLLIFLWIGRERGVSLAKTLAAFLLPGLVVGYFIVGSVLLAWPKGQFTWGAHSLLETGRSILRACLTEPNPYLLNPRLHHYFVHFGRLLYPLLGLGLVWRLVTLYLERAGERTAHLAWLCGAALIITLSIHQVLFSLYGVLLPLDRTGVYVATFCILMAGAAAAVPAGSLMGRASGRAMTVALTLIAIYSLGCLRLAYFDEWRWDADTKRVYSVLAYYNRTYGLTDVSVNWRYVAALNAYREMSGRETLHQIGGAPTEVDTYPPGFRAYVVFAPWDQSFIKREQLKVVYQDSFSGAAVAIRPELESTPCPH